MGLSCCIIADNEGDRIERCIRAVRGIVDEVVVVDSGSTDDTVAKAEALGAKVFSHEWDGYGPQKRFAEDCAANDWILNLDADEVLTPELAGEIAALMRSPSDLLPAYRFRQVTVYPGRDRPRLWADFHNYVRLYDRRRVRFRPSRVHDTVDTEDYPVGQLDGTALHYSWRTLEHVRAKLEKYTDLQAKELKKPRWYVLARLPFEYPVLFFRYYILRRNFTGGWLGLRIAHDIAAARFRRLLKILNYRPTQPAASTLDCVRSEVWTKSTTRFDADREGAATVLREIGYRGRQALVVTKQALGLSGRGDKTFYIEQFSRLLRSGSVKPSGIATIRRTDGAGAQAQAVMSAIAFAHAHNLPYVHRPFTSIEHAELDMPAWARLWEEYFNLGADEASLDVDGPPLVALDHLRFVPRHEQVITAAEHYLHYCNQDLLAWENVLPLLRAKYWQNKTPRARASELRVAVHIRRGDVTADNKKVAKNFTPNATFVNTLTHLKALAGSHLPPLRIEVFSQGEASMFADLRALGAELRLDEPAVTTHRALVEADILVMSKGAFSYTAAVLNDGITLYDPQKYRALQDWIARAPDGSFDTALVAQRLAAMLAKY